MTPTTFNELDLIEKLLYAALSGTYLAKRTLIYSQVSLFSVDGFLVEVCQCHGQILNVFAYQSYDLVLEEYLNDIELTDLKV